MGQIANIVEFPIINGATPQSHRPPSSHSGGSSFERLMPGASRESAREKSTARMKDKPWLLSRLAFKIAPRVFEKFDPAKLPVAVMDSALIALVFALAHRVFTYQTQVVPGLTLYLVLFLGFSVEEGLYSRQFSPPVSESEALLRTTLWATGLFVFLSASFPGGVRIVRLVSVGLGANGLLFLAREIWGLVFPPNKSFRNVLIVGSGPKARAIADAILRTRSRSRLVKRLMPEVLLRQSYGPAMLARITREEFIDEIIIASSDPEIAKAAIQQANRNKLDLRVSPQLCVELPYDAQFENLGGVLLAKIHEHAAPEYALAIKRMFDIFGSLFALFLLLPVMLAIGIFIKLTSPGPVLYGADRIGVKGQRFRCYKFRTMIQTADALKNDLRVNNERKGAFFKIPNDPRITGIGRCLRRYSLDELPQLWNVLRGEMSLVGPRPHPPDDVRLYGIQHLQRLDFVPGMTGLWQVTARRDPSFERSVALDVEYIKNWNFWLDFRILVKTINAVIVGSGV